MNEAVNAHTGQPRTGGTLGGCDLAMRPVMTDELSDQGMVGAEQVGCQVRHPPLNLAQLPLIRLSRWRLRVKPGQVRLDRIQTRLDQVEAAGHLNEG